MFRKSSPLVPDKACRSCTAAATAAPRQRFPVTKNLDFNLQLKSSGSYSEVIGTCLDSFRASAKFRPRASPDVGRSPDRKTEGGRAGWKLGGEAQRWEGGREGKVYRREAGPAPSLLPPPGRPPLPRQLPTLTAALKIFVRF